MAETQNLKALRRADFRYSLSYRTRWYVDTHLFLPHSHPPFAGLEASHSLEARVVDLVFEGVTMINILI